MQDAVQTNALDTLSADAIILGTTENLGYMSGALKDFFDRTYNETIEKKEGLPCAIYIRAGIVAPERRAIESIISGQKWRLVQAPLIFRGEWNEDFVRQAEELEKYLRGSRRRHFLNYCKNMRFKCL